MSLDNKGRPGKVDTSAKEEAQENGVGAHEQSQESPSEESLKGRKSGNATAKAKKAS